MTAYNTNLRLKSSQKVDTNRCKMGLTPTFGMFLEKISKNLLHIYIHLKAITYIFIIQDTAFIVNAFLI